MTWGIVLTVLGSALCFFSPMFLMSYVMGSTGHWTEKAIMYIYVSLTIALFGYGFYLIHQADVRNFEKKCADKGGHVTHFNKPDGTSERICVDAEGRIIQLSK